MPHPEPPPRVKAAPLVHVSWPPPDRKNWISSGTPEYPIDFAELLPRVPQSPVGILTPTEEAPVQSAPSKVVIMADIAIEAEARRAVATKTTLNCIMVRLRSF